MQGANGQRTKGAAARGCNKQRVVNGFAREAPTRYVTLIICHEDWEEEMQKSNGIRWSTALFRIAAWNASVSGSIVTVEERPRNSSRKITVISD